VDDLTKSFGVTTMALDPLECDDDFLRPSLPDDWGVREFLWGLGVIAVLALCWLWARA
jgi:hypothetical protein